MGKILCALNYCKLGNRMVRLQSADSGSYDQIISIKYDCKKLLGPDLGSEAPMVIIHLFSKIRSGELYLAALQNILLKLSHLT